MTKLIKLLVSALSDVTSACIKLLSVGMTSILHTAILRKVVGKSACDNPERYCG